MMHPFIHRHWPKLIGAIVCGLLLVYLLTRFPLREPLEAALNWSRGLGPMSYLVFVVLYVVCTVCLIPGTPLTLASGFIFGLGPGILISLAGTLSGSTSAFLLGRTLAHDAVERRMGHGPRFRALNRALKAQGLRIVMLMRLSPVFPFNILNYVLGATSLSVRSFVAGSAVGMIPGTFLCAYAGSLAQDLAEALSGQGTGAGLGMGPKLAGLAVIVLATIAITRIARRALHEAHVEEMTHRPPRH